MRVEQKRRITPLQVSLGSVYVVRSSEPSPGFGQATRRFFAEGEAHEANDWQDASLPPDDEPEERVQSGSFDKVPRKKGAMIALALFGLCLAAGVGFGVGALVQGGRAAGASIVDFARGVGFQPSEAPVPPPPALPAVAEEAAAATEPAFSPGPAAPASPATSPSDGANAEPEDPPAATAAPALPGTSAAAAVSADREPGLEEGREPSRTAAAKPAPRPRSALKAARQRAIMPALARPMGESLAKSRASEPGLDSSLEEASDPFATGALVPPRSGEPSIAPANTGAAAPEKAPPSPEELRVRPDDEAADPAPTAGSEPDPFLPGAAK